MRRVLVPMLALGCAVQSAAQSAVGAVRVRVDVSKTPNAQPYVGPVAELFRIWYPKIGAALFGNGAALPYSEVRVVFEPDIVSEEHTRVPAYTEGNTVHVSFAYIGVMPDDYRAMLIHELAHVIQH